MVINYNSIIEEKEIPQDIEREPLTDKKEERTQKLTILNFENIQLLKILIFCFSIALYFFFVFLRGNILLKSFANIE